MRRHCLGVGAIGLLWAFSVGLPAPLVAQDQDGGGEKPAAPAAPTPRRPDGTVNLAALPGGKGFWNNGLGSLLSGGSRALATNPTLEEVPFLEGEEGR